MLIHCSSSTFLVLNMKFALKINQWNHDYNDSRDRCCCCCINDVQLTTMPADAAVEHGINCGLWPANRHEIPFFWPILCGKLNRIECMLITNLCIAYAIITIINSQIGLNFGIFYEIGYLALTFYRRTKYCLTVSVFAHVVCP